MKTILAALILLASLQTVEAQVINAPDLQNGVLQMTASREVGPDTYWYWCYSSQAEGTHFYIADGDLPPLNDNDPAWQEVELDAWFDPLGPYGPEGGPATIQERAYLTDVLAYTYLGGVFEYAYGYLGWQEDSLEELEAESVLY